MMNGCQRICKPWNSHIDLECDGNSDSRSLKRPRNGRGTSSMYSGASIFTAGRHNIRHRDQDVNTLAKELNTLSVEERNRLYEEIHGVADIINETPELIASSIQELKACIMNTPRSKRKSLDHAYFLKPSLADDTAFNLMFLRAKRFKTQEAAECLCAYFSNKKMLFGEELLVERITLDHLNEDDLQMMREGSIQLLKDRESTGRVVQFSLLSLWTGYHWKTLGRYVWYTFMSLIEFDEEVQKRGMVWCSAWFGNVCRKTVLDFIWHAESLTKHWPVHVNSVHNLYDSPGMDIIFKGVRALLPKEIRIREKLHFGSILECKHMLLSYGINAHGCFEEETGILSRNFTQASIERRRAIEDKWRQTQPDHHANEFSLQPCPHDVLMGRAIWVREWPGNVILGNLVKSSVPRFLAVPSNDATYRKTVIVMDIIMTLKEQHGTRFLEKNENGWKQVSSEATRTRVSQQLRNAINRGMGV